MSAAFPVGARIADRKSGDRGTVVESPAIDPDGNVWPCHVAVRWDDEVFEIVATAELRRVE